MSVTEASTVDVEPAPEDSPRQLRRAFVKPDLFVGVAYTLAGVFVTGHLWLNLGTRVVAMACDQIFFMWVLRHAARAITMGENPFVSHQVNAPDGVNLMANTSALALTMPLTPVTVLFGPRASFVLLLVIGLAGTAFAWYKVLQRIVPSRSAAVVGGAFCGFAPGMISHANGHVNWVAQFVVPFLVLATLRLAEPGSVVKRGVVLGLLATVQAFINEEVLLCTAIGIAVFLVAYGAFMWRDQASEVRAAAARIVRGGAIGAGVAAVLLAYPLYVQFFGPQSYHGLPDGLGQVGTDLASYWSFSRLSLAGSGAATNPLALNITEENTFFGWPLLVVMAAGLAWLWPRILARAIAVTALVFVVLSLGPTLIASQRDLAVPLPWAVLGRLPLLDSALPTRFSLALIPLFGVGLALIIQRVRELPEAAPRRVAYVALAAALLPLLPGPLPSYELSVTPTFVTSGAWKNYVPEGRTLVPVPDNSPDFPMAMAWLADSNADFAISGGYFLGAGPDRQGFYGTYPERPTTKLFLRVSATGETPVITDQMRRDLQADLRYWRASVMVLPSYVINAAELRSFVDQLMGQPGQQVEDVVLWRVSG